MFSGPKSKYLLLGGGALILLAVVAFFWTRGPANEDPNPEYAKIDRLERKKDAQGLAEALKGSDPGVVCRAMSALVRVQGNEARGAVEPFLRDTRSPVRATAAREFALATGRHNVEPLIVAFKAEKDPQVKASMAEALGDTRAWEGMAVLIPAVDDPNPEVRQSAVNGIERISGHRPSLYSQSTQADRKKAIARMNQDLPKMKSIYDKYWQGKP